MGDGGFETGSRQIGDDIRSGLGVSFVLYMMLMRRGRGR